jgi:hypothetical protein
MTNQAAPSKPNEDGIHGHLVAEALFARKSVRLYSGGYVRISGPFSKANAPFEKLLGISGSADVSKKTGLGRSVAFVLTGGINLLSPNKRGDLYLSIFTEKQSHSL